MPVTDYAAAGEFNYYTFVNDQPGLLVALGHNLFADVVRHSVGASLVFMLTSVTGDADIYVSNNASVTRPQFSNAMWWGRNYGSDVIDVFATDPNACQVPCNYYIGVTADSYSGNSTCVLFCTLFGATRIYGRLSC